MHDLDTSMQDGSCQRRSITTNVTRDGDVESRRLQPGWLEMQLLLFVNA